MIEYIRALAIFTSLIVLFYTIYILALGITYSIIIKKENKKHE